MTKAPALAMMNTNAKAIFLTGLKIKNTDKYKFYVEEIKDPGSEYSIEERILLISQNICDAIAKVIYEYPEDWFWIHRRFKTQEKDSDECFYE